MNMLKNKKVLALLGGILALFSAAVWATSASVEWNPSRFAPASIAPGESMNAVVVFTNKGPSTINGKKLSLEVRGGAASIVFAMPPTFPQTIKKGESIPVNLSVASPADAPLSVVTGSMVIIETLPNGKIKDFSAFLPIEITLSPIPLPPDPGKIGEMTIQGIDSDANGVRDDIDRYIVFTYPNSAKVREALKQEARALIPFLLDANDKEKTRANNLEENKANDCLYYISGLSVDVEDSISGVFLVQFLNTKERSRAYNRADGQLGGASDPRGSVLLSDRENHYKGGCSFDPGSLPN